MPDCDAHPLTLHKQMMGQAKLEQRQAIHARKLREMLVSLGPVSVLLCVGESAAGRECLGASVGRERASEDRG